MEKNNSKIHQMVLKTTFQIFFPISITFLIKNLNFSIADMSTNTYLSPGVRQLLSSVSCTIHKATNDLSMTAIRQCVIIEGIH